MFSLSLSSIYYSKKIVTSSKRPHLKAHYLTFAKLTLLCNPQDTCLRGYELNLFIFHEVHSFPFKQCQTKHSKLLTLKFSNEVISYVFLIVFRKKLTVVQCSYLSLLGILLKYKLKVEICKLLFDLQQTLFDTRHADV